MPELPEVETVRKSLAKFLEGKSFKKIKVIYKPIIANSNQQELEKRILNKKITKVDRIGKFLLIRIGEYTLISHLRMEGKYYFGKYKGSLMNRKDLVELDLNSEMIDQFHKHIHVIFEIEDNSLLIYHDTRKFGKFHLFKTGDELTKPPLKKLAKEPFTLSQAELYQGLIKRTIPIKQALLDQNLIAGLGNIYVDETLSLAGISPFLPANKINKDEAKKLLNSSILVLNKAINMGGSTIRSYHVDNEISGKFQNELFVYGKEGQPCKKCSTPIVKTFINGRGTHFCPQCQPLKINSNFKIIGVTGIISSGKSTVAKELEKFGYEIIDADKLVRQAYSTIAVIKKIVAEFGKDVLDNGAINFLVLRNKALSIKNGLLKLEKIVHPFVIKTTKAILKQNPNKKYVLDVPLLFESGMNQLCDVVIFVNINDLAWRKRVVEANKMPLKDAKTMRSRMLPNEFKIKNSQIILDNSGNLASLKRQINRYSSFFKTSK